jgi:hypothetical protein
VRAERLAALARFDAVAMSNSSHPRFDSDQAMFAAEDGPGCTVDRWNAGCIDAWPIQTHFAFG